MIKGAVFDLDGVLVDTEGFQWQGWVEALKPLGKTVTREEYFDYAGKSSSEIESLIIRNHQLNIRKGVLRDEKKKLILDWFENRKIRALPYAREAVMFFRSRNFRVGCASGGGSKETGLKLKKTGLYALFDAIVSRDDVKRGKPSPDVYISCAKKLGLRPEECVAFEDTRFGVEAAKAARMLCFAVPNKFTAGQDFSKADGVFGNLKEALKGIQEII